MNPSVNRASAQLAAHQSGALLRADRRLTSIDRSNAELDKIACPIIIVMGNLHNLVEGVLRILRNSGDEANPEANFAIPNTGTLKLKKEPGKVTASLVMESEKESSDNRVLHGKTELFQGNPARVSFLQYSLTDSSFDSASDSDRFGLYADVLSTLEGVPVEVHFNGSRIFMPSVINNTQGISMKRNEFYPSLDWTEGKRNFETNAAKFMKEFEKSAALLLHAVESVLKKTA